MSKEPQNPRVQHPDYYSGERRFGGGHIRPPHTPVNTSPISKAADLKIYHTGASRFNNAYERSMLTAYSAPAHAIVSNANRNEQTGGAASSAHATYERLKDVAALAHAFDRTGGRRAMKEADHKLSLIDSKWKKDHRPEVKAHRAEIREIKHRKAENGSLSRDDKRELKQKRSELKESKRGLDSKGVEKSVRKAEKIRRKGGELSDKDRLVLERMKTRQKYQKKLDKVAKAKASRRQLKRSLAGAAGKAMKESDQAGAQTLSSAVGIVRNPYVRKVLTTVKKGAVGTWKTAKRVTKPVRKVAGNAARKLDKAINKGRLTKRVDRLKQRKKTKRLNKANRKELARVKKQLKKEKKLAYRFAKWFKGTKVGHFFGRVGNVFKSISSAFGATKGFIKKILAHVAGGFLLICLLISAINGIVAVISNLLISLGLMDDGRIILREWVDLHNEVQSEIIDDINFLKMLEGKEYNGYTVGKVYVNYLGSGGSSNFEEVMAMTGVRFSMDFEQGSVDHFAAETYAAELWKATNLISMSESDVYYCSGCVERTYRCSDPVTVLEDDEPSATDERLALISRANHAGEENVSPLANKGCRATAYSCMEKGHSIYNPEGCFQHNDGRPFVALGAEESCDNYTEIPSYNQTQKICLGHCEGAHIDYSCPGTHKEKVCPGHVDFTVNVTCMGFDEIFDHDPVEYLFTDLGDYETGEEIGVFEITYYCTEKYPHTCNAGPPYETASGTTPTPGRTIAVDPDVIPLGSKVIIDGHVYTAEDTGGAIKGNRIDIAVSSHEDAMSLGVKDAKVYWAVEATGEKEQVVENDTFHTRANIDYLQIINNSTSDLWHAFLGTAYRGEEGFCTSGNKTSTYGCTCFDNTIRIEAASLLLLSKFLVDEDTMAPLSGIYVPSGFEPASLYGNRLEASIDILSEYDRINPTKVYTSVEWNVLQYIQWPVEDLRAKAKEIDPDYSVRDDRGSSESFELLWNIIIPWEAEQWEANKDNPDAQIYLPEYGKEAEEVPGETVPVTPDGTTSVGNIDFSQYSFDGWTDGNREWAKSVVENITDEFYRGLEKVRRTDAPGYDGYSFEGLEITGCLNPIKYFSQHDSRWANKPILPSRSTTKYVDGVAKRTNTHSSSGCGFSTMAIVISSLTETSINPVEMAARYPGYYSWGHGAYHSMIKDVSTNFGLTCEELHKSKMQTAIDALNEGKLVVALVGRGGLGWTGNGYYKGGGHFLVICGMSEDGDFYLADPNRPDMVNNDGSPKPVNFNYFVASGIQKLWIVGK